MTPTDSPLRFGPSSFRPTIQLEGKYVAFAVSPDAARAATRGRATEGLEASAALLTSLGESAAETGGTRRHRRYREPAILAGKLAGDAPDHDQYVDRPGQRSSRQGSDSRQRGPARRRDARSRRHGRPGPQPRVPGRHAGRRRPRRSMPAGDPAGRGGPSRPGGTGSLGAGGGFGGAAGGSTPPAITAPGSTTPGSANDSMVVLKIDADKLPKAADLKALSLSQHPLVVVSDQDIKFVSRGAFPNLSVPTSVAPIAGAIPGLSVAHRPSEAGPGRRGRAPRLRRAVLRATPPHQRLRPGLPPGTVGGRRGGGRSARARQSSHRLRSPLPEDPSMEFVHEVTAYLENKPGRLAKICSALAQEKVDIRALSVMETDGPSVLQVHHDRPGDDQERADLAGNRIPHRRGAGRADREPHRLAGQGPGEARGGTYQRRICLRLDDDGSGQGSGDLPHLEPQARRSDLERGRRTRSPAPAVRRAVVRCTRGDAAECTHAPRADFAADLTAPETSGSREEEESPGRPPEEPPESDAGQRPDPTVPRRRADAGRDAGDRSSSPQGRAVAAPHDHRGSRGRREPRANGHDARCLLEAGRRSLDMPARTRRPGARPGLDGPVGRRPDLFLPCPRPAQDPGDRGPERRHRRRPASGSGPDRPPESEG